jgi:uncharacterized membrane protein YcaP (DUF421 family)
VEDKTDIELFDPRRLLIGNTPWGFLAEVAVRGVLVYVLLLIAIRFMGKRVAGQLSLSELAVMVTLGAAIGVPIQVADRGMLPALVLLIVAVVYQRLIGALSFKSRRIELLTQGDIVTLVTDGIMSLSAMRGVGLSHERVFAALRERGVLHLGQLARVYIETSGSFSVYEQSEPRPGLAIVPAGHPGLNAIEGSLVCAICGTVMKTEERRAKEELAPCPTCSRRAWAPPVLAKKT